MEGPSENKYLLVSIWTNIAIIFNSTLLCDYKWYNI